MSGINGPGTRGESTIEVRGEGGEAHPPNCFSLYVGGMRTRVVHNPAIGKMIVILLL